MLYHHLQAPSSENTNFWNRSRWFLGRLIFSDVHVLSESPWLPLWVVNVDKHPVQVTCSSSVFFWNGYSVLRFSLNMHFYFFLSLFLSEAFIKILQSITKKKLQPSFTINDETIVMRVFKLHAVYSPAGRPLLYFLYTFHKYLIFPFFISPDDWWISSFVPLTSKGLDHSHWLVYQVVGWN